MPRSLHIVVGHSWYRREAFAAASSALLTAWSQRVSRELISSVLSVKLYSADIREGVLAIAPLVLSKTSASIIISGCLCETIAFRYRVLSPQRME